MVALSNTALSLDVRSDARAELTGCNLTRAELFFLSFPQRVYFGHMYLKVMRTHISIDHIQYVLVIICVHTYNC
jgi:hypothetical protein